MDILVPTPAFIRLKVKKQTFGEIVNTGHRKALLQRQAFGCSNLTFDEIVMLL